jgi:mannose-6-phosphate isomerase
MERFGPLPLRPRLDVKPWGGRLLAQFGLPLLSEELIGEAVITAPDAVVGDGQLAGRTLEEIVTADPAGASGPLGLAVTGGRPRFPLLIKLIDAADNLSIQVHPSDEMAVQEDDSLGKTEAWHVLAARPGSALYLGLRTGISHTDFAAAAGAGTPTAPLVRRLEACPNTTYLIPAGTIHALGAGVLIYEVQQPSTVTYRLDDWGRVDAAGNPREMHIEQGLAVADVESRPQPIPPLDVRSVAGRRQWLTVCRYFALERIALAAGEQIPIVAPGSPQVITCVRGAARVTADEQTRPLDTGGSVALLAASPDGLIQATHPSVMLRAWVPSTDVMALWAEARG